MVNRRRLMIGGVGVIVAGALGLVGVDLAAEHQIVAGIRRRLSFLQLDESGLHEFAKAQIAATLAKRPTWYRWKYHFRELTAKKVKRWGIGTDPRTGQEHKVDNWSTIYLLSSDFFTNGSDESRIVKYVAIYDPLRACGNPFARRPTEVES